ncbi:tetratricopeptide repeat protein [Micromonospora sp. HUAS LYJ1]|uniref:tetratricopeptide repeat protein n=1 Tax=Micromonospora sp. HUAS LYJ1 TaxID=3061626 RepID=UPI002672DFA5|nr:tetratricopeptide repeat protein [Micromonospora sp. HUAS LYJ1]WKU05362.1 tetratricopeptide repeat protein [Micromonospora sp. HUAS LYJ1]
MADLTWRDPAALPLRPLIDLTADPTVAPSLVAEAALFCADRPDPCGWLPVHAPPADLRRAMRCAGLLDATDPLVAPPEVAERLTTEDHAGLLWAARLMRALGRRDDAAQLLRRIGGDAPPPVHAWRDLLLAEDSRQPLPPVPSEAAGLPVRLTTALAHARSAVANGQPAGEALTTAESLAAALAGDRIGAVAQARILAVRLRCPGEPVPDADTVRAVAHDLGADRTDLLARDAALALLRAATRAALDGTGVGSAYEFASAALALDPTGAATRLLAADAARAAGDREAARTHYRVAARTGLTERTSALAGLLDLATPGANSEPTDGSAPAADTGELVGAVADLLATDCRAERDRLAVLVARRPALEGRVCADAVRWAVAVQHPAAGARPLPLERYRPFLDLSPSAILDPVDTPPVAIHTPLMSYAAVLERREPWFREIHPQRATAVMFRDELQATAAVYGYASDAASADYATWLAASDGCPPEVRDRLANVSDLPLLDRALLGRLLSALGFHAEAKRILPGPDVPVRAPESAYALASWIFAEQMLTTGHAAELEPHFRTLYDQLGDDVRYARTRVVTTINATVNAARRREPDTIARWRKLGEEDLARYTGLPEVSEFDAAIMTSRWFRAMGFLPFLTGDRDLLRADMDRWLGIAREVTGHDEHTRIIAADNYFPAVETAVRTHTFLDEHDAALALVDELAQRIDPIDPKTWLTAGELRYQAGDHDGALQAYLRAAHLQFPYGRISWFNAGQLHEQLGRADLAAECYRLSLAHWPTGVTPLRRLRDLHLRGLLPDDGGVLAAWIAGQPAWSQLPAFPG